MNNCYLQREYCFVDMEADHRAVEEQKMATFLLRSVAMFIDFCLLNCVVVTMFSFGGYQAALLVLQEANLLYDLSLAALLLFFVAPFFFSMTYFTFLHSYGGRTIGKAIMGIRVVGESGKSLDLGQSFLRWVGYFVSALPLLAGFLWVVLEVKHRAWHDLLAETKVICEKMS